MNKMKLGNLIKIEVGCNTMKVVDNEIWDEVYRKAREVFGEVFSEVDNEIHLLIKSEIKQNRVGYK